MGFALARVETCKSAISAKRSCGCGRSQGISANSTSTIAAVPNARPVVNQEGRDLDRGAVTRRIFDCSSGDGTNLALAARLIEIFNFLLPNVAAAQSWQPRKCCDIAKSSCWDNSLSRYASILSRHSHVMGQLL